MKRKKELLAVFAVVIMGGAVCTSVVYAETREKREGAVSEYDAIEKEYVVPIAHHPFMLHDEEYGLYSYPHMQQEYLLYEPRDNEYTGIIGDDEGGNADTTVLGENTSRNTLYVGGGGPNNYTNIQDAIDNASNGDTVFVYNGTYYENVVVNKTIDLIGENRNTTIIDGSGGGDIITVTADGVRIEGFTVQNGGEDGIELSHAQNCHIVNNTVTNITTFRGIYLYYSDNTTVSGNSLTDNWIGLFLVASSNNTVSGNTMTNNNGFALYIYSSNNTISGNSMVNNWIGLYLGYSSNNIISDNIIANNSNEALSLYSSNSNIISGNMVVNNSYYFSGTYALSLDSSNSNIIYNNYFSNANNAFDNGNNIWNISKTPGTNIIGGPYLGGSFWSDYMGYDIDGDGLGNTNLPYNCSGNITNGGDWHPLVAPSFPPVDYIIITFETENEIPDGNISTGFTFTAYASAFNNTHGFIYFIDVNWSLANYGSNASINTTYGASVTFNPGILNGTAVLTIDDGNGHTDTVTLTINENFFSFMLYPGWNLIGWWRETSTTASSLGGAIADCTMLAKYDAAGASFTTFLVGITPPGSHWDFAVIQGMGLFVKVTSQSIWNGEG